MRRRRILITGAGGSIGSALALRLAALSPACLVLLEASESHLFALQNVLAEPAIPLLGNAANPALIDEIFARYSPDLVFHAAAFKHVPLLEAHPLEAIENNVFGTQAVVSAAARRAHVVLLSTDKSVEPASILGATKRIAEQIVLAAGGTALRLGNVLGSRGSVAEIFAGQIATGGPITVTDPAARRYFLTVDEAVHLLLAAAIEPLPPRLLAPALPAPHYIVDFAEFLARHLAPGRSIPVQFTQARPGDKEDEQLWSASESAHPACAPDLFDIRFAPIAAAELQCALASLRAALDARNTAAALALVRQLVPDYTPGTAVLALAGEHATRVTL